MFEPHHMSRHGPNHEQGEAVPEQLRSSAFGLSRSESLSLYGPYIAV